MSTTPGAGRDRPGSSTAPPGNNTKKSKVGAALDPTHHQRGCRPARRSNPSGTRQGIKTASASRKIGRESTTLSPRRMSTTPGAGRDRPGSSTAPPGNNTKKSKVGAALDPTHHQRGCRPARRSNPSGTRQGIKTASASRKIGRESTTLSPRRMSTTPGAGRDRPGSSTAPPGNNTKKSKVGAALDPTHHQRGCRPAR